MSAVTIGSHADRRWIAYGPVVIGFAVVAAACGLAIFCALRGQADLVQNWATYPGLPTRAADVVGYFVAMVSGACVVGARVLVITGARPDRAGRIDAGVYRASQLAGRSAIAWALVATVMVFISTADGSGIGLGRLMASSNVADAVLVLEQSRGWIAVALCAALAAIPSLRWVGQCVLLIPALIGIVAEPVTGNAGSGANHDYATSAVIVFWIALAAVLGVKATMLNGLGRRDATNVLTEPLMRKRLDLTLVFAGAVVLVYGAILLVLLLPLPAVTTTDYGRLAVVAAVLLTAAWLIDVALFIRTRRGRPTRGHGSTVLTVVLVLAAVAAISAMATQPAPGLLSQPFTAWDVLLGYQLPRAPNLVRILTTWRFDPLLGVAGVMAAAAYLGAVRRLRGRGDSWSRARTASWMSGCVGLVFTSSSGLKAYGSAMFSVHMAEHMVWNMVLPVLLVIGAPVTLALRALPTAGAGKAPGLREWLTRLLHSPLTRWVAHPIVAPLVFVVSLYAVYFTPIFDTLVRYHWGHEVMSLHFLITGYLFFWVIIGVDPGPRRLPFIGRLQLTFAVMPFHVFFAIAVMTMGSLIGGTFYRYLALPWLHDLNHDQWLGGAIAWAISEVPFVFVGVALVTQWAAHERRIGQRHDRHADSYGDDELAAYNAMLAELARSRR